MLRRFWKSKPSVLDEPIENILSEMNTYGPDSQEYPALLSYLERLIQMKNENGHFRISADTAAIVAGNLMGIVIIVAYEQKHVIGSKGLGFVIKPKQISTN
jgi:hypothetical protein